MPWRVSTRPEACSLEMASRTTVRLTPNSAMNAASVGSLSPGGKPAVADAVAQRLDQFQRQAARPAAQGFDA